MLLVLDQIQGASITRDSIKRFEAVYVAFQALQPQRQALIDSPQNGLWPDLKEALSQAFALQDEWASCEVAPMFFRARQQRPNDAAPRGGPPLGSAGGLPIWDLFRGTDQPTRLSLDEAQLRLQTVRKRYFPLRRTVETLYREKMRRSSQGLP